MEGGGGEEEQHSTSKYGEQSSNLYVGRSEISAPLTDTMCFIKADTVNFFLKLRIEPESHEAWVHN